VLALLLLSQSIFDVSFRRSSDLPTWFSIVVVVVVVHATSSLSNFDSSDTREVRVQFALPSVKAIPEEMASFSFHYRNYTNAIIPSKTDAIRPQA
jgi:hypothetical protein